MTENKTNSEAPGPWEFGCFGIFLITIILVAVFWTQLVNKFDPIIENHISKEQHFSELYPLINKGANSNQVKIKLKELSNSAIERDSFSKSPSEYLKFKYDEKSETYGNYTFEENIEYLKNYYLLYHYKDSNNFIEKCDSIILKNKILNPFEGLTNNQKYYLSNIRAKLDSTYEKVDLDMENLMLELKNKNKIEREYIEKLRSNARNSGLALFFAIVSLIVAFFKKNIIEFFKQISKTSSNNVDDDHTS